MAKVNKSEFKDKKPLGKKLKGRVTKSGITLVRGIHSGGAEAMAKARN